MKQTLNISLDSEILSKAKNICQKRKTTLNQLIRGYLEKCVQQDDDYQKAWKFIKERMQQKPISVGRCTAMETG